MIDFEKAISNFNIELPTYVDKTRVEIAIIAMDFGHQIEKLQNLGYSKEAIAKAMSPYTKKLSELIGFRGEQS